MGTPTIEWADAAHRALADSGRRTGGARARVIGLFAATGGGLTAQEAFDALAAGDHPVGFSSVYRSLAVLAELGVVRSIQVGGVARFDLVLASGSHAHHIICDECHKTESFVSDDIEHLIEDVAASTPYLVQSHDIILHGLCPDCTPQAQAPPTAYAVRIDDAPEPLS